MAERYKDPWADAANQAVGALYKYYLTKPTPADAAAAELEAQTKQEQLRRLQLQNKTDDSALGLGNFTLPNLSPEIRNDLYRRSVEGRGESDAAKLFGTYVNKPMQVDAGDAKYIVDGSTGLPIQEYGVGVAPKVEVDTQGGQVIRTPGVAAPNRPAMPVAGDNPVAHLMASLIQQESGGDPNAVSPKGATGLTQVMPSTAVDPGFGVKNIFERAEERGIPVPSYDEEGAKLLLNDPQLNLEFGQDYLAAMKGVHGSDELALASYNAGPGAVQKAGGIPAFPETQQYVQNVMQNAGQPQPAAAQPAPMSDGTVITPLPKSPAAQAKEDERNRLKGISADLVNDEVNRSLNVLNEKGGSVAGFIGNMTSGIPGLPAHDFSQMLDTIKANIGFDKLQSMREASPTGGALGQVSEFENRLLQAVFGSLAQSQSPEQLRYNLMRLQNTYNNIMYRGYNDDGTLRLQNNIGPAPHNIPTLDNVGQMNSPEELQKVLEFFNYDPPADIKQMVIQRANQLGL